MTASPSPSPGTYYLHSFGCQMNEHDAERIRAVAEGLGLRRVGEPQDGDVLIYNTCTVRQSADERLAGHVSLATRLKREDPRRVVVLAGCLPQAQGEQVFRTFPCVDVAVGPQALPQLRELLAAVLARRSGAAGGTASRPAPAPSSDRPRRSCFDDGERLSGDLPAVREPSCQAWVQVMSGCTNRCSYCIVPDVRGRERSRDADDIVAEVRGLVADGVQEVTLLGQNVNAYGLDLRRRGVPSIGFAALLRRLDAVEGLSRIRFMTSHPRDLSDELIAAMADCTSVCEHLHLPAQSGSDRVLRAMRRGYSVAWYLDRLAAVRGAVPGISVTTDLIAGFPGESDDDFQATLDLVRRAGFDAAFTFVFSPRPGTPAAELPAQVPFEVRRDRVRRLIALTQAQSLERHSRLVGRVMEVLVEGRSRRGDCWRGRTRDNLTVNFTGAARPGALLDVRITQATSTTLKGCV
ncbi:MAG: tRNA (N6-isopentenyl adenosine(37)-C2)-methylthiotransferase MiaB [Actinobacteria bacterium]|nr:tRNA (N6-isopentenyl adenosine(37)-C2)-methylthiotransferase MiaB [Actinomycetota bacterium]